MATFTIEGYNSYSGCDITVTATLPSLNGSQNGPGKYYTLGSIQTLSISTHQDKRPVRSLGVINAKDYVMGPRTIAGSMVFAVFNKHFAIEIMKDLGATGASVILPDEIPSLDITINFANEYGRMSRMAIYGVKIINEGQVMSINDLYTENTYQFVALGLEPLNAEVSTSEEQKNTKKKIRSPFTISNKDGDVFISDSNNSLDTLFEDNEYNNNSGTNISRSLLNNDFNINASINDYKTINYYENIQLSVRVEQPSENDNLGLAIFTLIPNQLSGVIIIYDASDNDKQYYITVSDRNNYVISLPLGTYIAQFSNDFADTSNTVEFTIEEVFYSSDIEYEVYYPTIEKVTNTSITVSSGNYTHTLVNCYKSGGKLITKNIGKKPITISDLEPNTLYHIYTSTMEGLVERSEIITVKTYDTDNKELLIFKDYIVNNQALLTNINIETDINFEDVDINNYNTLIDYVLTLPESDTKQELLIYANKLTQQLISSHNKSNDTHIMSNLQSTPFDSVIDVRNFNKANIFKCNNYKTILQDSINPTEESFYAKPNQHYYACGLLENKTKSVKYDFVVCKPSAQKALQNYCDVEKYKQLNYDAYIDRYKLFSYDTVEVLTIKDNCFSDINVIEPPYIYQTDKGLIADVDYLNLNKNEEYYLVCEDIYSALDYTPHRKIPFNFNTKTIQLDDYYLGLVEGNRYLFWIENKDYVKLSKPALYLFESDNIYTEIQSIQKQELYSKLAFIKKEFVAAFGNKTLANDFFDYINSCNPQNKHLPHALNTELINQFENSLYVSNTLNPLFELNKIIHKSNDIKNIPEIEIDRKNRVVKFGDLKGMYICAIHYDEISADKIEDYNNTIYYGQNGYTLIYLISNHMMYKSGFILIDNVSNTYRYTDDLKIYIKEVGDK